MDYKRLAKWIIGLGAFILIIGIVVYILNQPLSNGDGLLGALKAFVNNHENEQRETSRIIGAFITGLGAVIAFSGLAMLFSLKE